GPAADQAPALHTVPGATGQASPARAPLSEGELDGRVGGRLGPRGHDCRRRGLGHDPVRADRSIEPDPWRLTTMSREILEAVRGLAAEKNISSEKLMEALEDALLSAYKKTPEAAKYAKVEMDRDTADF